MPSKIHNLEIELGRAPEIIKITSLILQPLAVSSLKLCRLRTENICGSGSGGALHQEDVSSELRVQREQHKR